MHIEVVFFRAAGVDLFAPICGRQVGAGGGWTAFLLGEICGADVHAFDGMAPDESGARTYVPSWGCWPWSERVGKGSLEVLDGSEAAGQSLALVCAQPAQCPSTRRSRTRPTAAPQ